MKGASVLIVDGDPAVRLLVRRGFATAGYRVYDAEPGPAALGLIGTRKPDVLLLDYDEGGGREVIHRRVRAGGRQVSLARKPFEVLRVLAEGANRVIPHEQIMRAVWGDRSVDRITYLRLAIRQLRRQLEPDPAEPRYILTEQRVGYRLVIARRPPRQAFLSERSSQISGRS